MYIIEKIGSKLFTAKGEKNKVKPGTIAKQNSGEYSEPWKSYGCRALCLAAIPQLEQDTIIAPSKIEKELKALGNQSESIVDLSNARCGKNEHLIIYRMFSILKSPKKGRQVGVRNPDGSGWNPNADHDYKIVEYPTSGSVGTHYIVLDRNGGMLYDPWEGDSLLSGQPTKYLLYKVWE